MGVEVGDVMCLSPHFLGSISTSGVNLVHSLGDEKKFCHPPNSEIWGDIPPKSKIWGMARNSLFLGTKQLNIE